MANLVSVVFIVLAAAIHSGQSLLEVPALPAVPTLPNDTQSLLTACSQAQNEITVQYFSFRTLVDKYVDEVLNSTDRNCSGAANQAIKSSASQAYDCFDNQTKTLLNYLNQLNTTCSSLEKNPANTTVANDVQVLINQRSTYLSAAATATQDCLRKNAADLLGYLTFIARDPCITPQLTSFIP